jgi:hypothetical protein
MISSQDQEFYEKENDELYALILRLINLKWVPEALSKGIYNLI